MLNHVLDKFLGLHHIGSLAINQIQPGGAAQLTHTDYPPGFYPVEDLRRVFTSYALHKIMPYFSLQAGIALCDMDRLGPTVSVTSLMTGFQQERLHCSHSLQSHDRGL